MLDIAKLLETSPPPRPLLPGSHGSIADRYRWEALKHVAMSQIIGEMFDMLIRQQPITISISTICLSKSFRPCRSYAPKSRPFDRREIVTGRERGGCVVNVHIDRCGT